MLSRFYQRNAGYLLGGCLLLLPLLFVVGESIPSNNSIETWLPRDTPVRLAYDEFYRTFGDDQCVLIAFPQPFPAEALSRSLGDRLRRIPGVKSCWTGDDLKELMAENGVREGIADQRLQYLLTTPADELYSFLVTFDAGGDSDPDQTVAAIREQLLYCGVQDQAVLVGAPIVAGRLNDLGSREGSRRLFAMTLLVCGLLLWWNTGCGKLASALVVANLFSIQLTQSVIALLGYEMNFILGSLPVMVMVFTTAAAIHFLGHYQAESLSRDRIGRAFRGVIRPSLPATFTTVIGLLSLAVSGVGPIPAFGQAAAVGTIVSLLVGLGVTPAIVSLVGVPEVRSRSVMRILERVAMRIVNHPAQVLIPGLAITLVCGVGVFRLKSLIDPLEFLPQGDRVRTDTLLVQEKLTSPTSIEAVVDFEGRDSSFVQRLQVVRDLQMRLREDPNVCHTFSVADFFPEELHNGNLSLSRLAASSGSRAAGSLISDGTRLWRISVRLKRDSPAEIRATLDRLHARTEQDPVVLTGMGPLLEQAQTDIFLGFWESFASAFLLISLVMVLALRSPWTGLLAMIPNLTPILLVFGVLGWSDYPIDIGIMMTASIALGMAVDGTFHFLFSFRASHRRSGCRYRAVRNALLKTGRPIISSAVICGTGLLALGLSPFQPTMRFGVLMFALLTVALVGDLILLPAFLALGARRRRLSARQVRTHMAQAA